jgi:hypothetical protein
MEGGMDAAQVVWWALPLGGLLGGIAKPLIDGRIEFPFVSRDKSSGQLFLLPGFIGPLVLGPIAALVVGGLAAATFDFQTAFDVRGFMGPFIASIPAGIAADQLLQAAAKKAVDSFQERVVPAVSEEVQGKFVPLLNEATSLIGRAKILTDLVNYKG